jgi:mannose-6-phosphate isomerase-like protein (cupin superfamily)
MTRDPLPGAVGLSHLAVYDSTAPDGEYGGSPHMHLSCTEAYVVQSGRGRIQTLSADGFAETPVEALDVVWFTPGVVHRIVNDGDLQILVVMQNDGLPEAGDAVFTFPADVLADPEAYARAAAIGAPGTVYAAAESAAIARRDLAVRGYADLRAAVKRGGPAALEPFHAAALALVRERIPEWGARWRDGALAAAQRTGDILEALQAGETRTLAEARVHRTRAGDDPRRLGMCGRLATVDIRSLEVVS